MSTYTSPSPSNTFSAPHSTLSSTQIANANLIWAYAKKAGLTDNQALEMVGASYAESNLDATNYVGKNTGGPFIPGQTAAGLFQLLSSGYVSYAQSHGGLFDPQANIQAILPEYVANFKANPNAAPGYVASITEKSGEPPSWYNGGIVSFVNALGAGGPGQAAQFLGAHSSSFTTTLGQIPLVGTQVKGAATAAEGAFSAVESTGNFFAQLTNPWLWLRIGEVVLGALLIGGALILVAKDVGASTPSIPSFAQKPADEGEDLQAEFEREFAAGQAQARRSAVRRAGRSHVENVAAAGEAAA